MDRNKFLQGILLLLAFLPLCGQAKVYMIVTATNEQLTVLQLSERPVLKFADGTSYSFENYFTRKNFKDLVDALEEQEDKAEDIWDN